MKIKKMQDKILELLINAKEWYTKVMNNYTNVLPPKLIQNGTTTYESSLPMGVNDFLSILNMAEGEKVYKMVDNVDDAIQLFESDEDIQDSIDKAITNKSIKGYGSSSDEEYDAKELLDNVKSAIKESEEFLKIQLTTAMMAKDNQ